MTTPTPTPTDTYTRPQGELRCEDVADDYTDTSIFQGVIEFAVAGERYRYHDRGAGVWSRYERGTDPLGGGCYVHTGTVRAPADATPRQLHRA